jgi:hypothetical protein
VGLSPTEHASLFWTHSLANIDPCKIIDAGMVTGHDTRDASRRRDRHCDRFALAARRDLLLKMLALHHQIAVVARSSRRFRPSDRLL